jgi:hypothetical protein
MNMPQRASPAVGCLHRARGWVLIGTSLAIGLVGWIALAKMADALRAEPDHSAAIGEYARWTIAHRGMIPLLTLVPLLAGVMLSISTSRRSAFWGLWTFAIVWQIGLFIMVLVAFVNFLAPLYRYQPI